MSRKDKLLAKLLRRPKDFSYNELCSLLRYFGYEEIRTGKTGGSRRAFAHHVTKHIIRLHKPHPSNNLKLYQVDEILSELKKTAAI